MHIQEAIIHGLKKEAKASVVTENFRHKLSDIDGRMENLGEGVLREYARQSDSYGTFDPDQQTYTFSTRLDEYFNGQVDLIDFSISAARLIAAKMKDSPLSTGGYVLFIRYTNQGRDWLLVVMLKLKSSTGVDPQTLELQENLSFDINNLHEAARIDLSKWVNDEQPYLSFIKKSSSKDEVTKYFRLALGCTEYTDSHHNTAQAVAALESYCKAKGWEGDRAQAARSALYAYFDEKYNSEDKVVHLKSLSGQINDTDPDDFYNHIKLEGIPVSDTFSPAKKVYAKLKVIRRKFGTVSVRFEAQDVMNDIVDYDEDNDMLYIKNIPQSLKDDILRAKGYDPE
ncbi:nucleoid-associated protein YejK [Halomonas shantousis]